MEFEDDFPQALDPNAYDFDSETQVSEAVYEGMSESAVADLLRDQGIPNRYCTIFEGMWL